MDTSYMREFLVLAKHLNYTSAAQALYISQPTLSRHISALEEELGVTLLNRTRHAVSLTPSGEEAVISFGSIMQHCDELVSQIGKISYDSVSGLAVGMIYFDLSTFYGNRLIDTFAENNPEIHVSKIQTQVTRVSVNLEKRVIDVALAMSSSYFENDTIKKHLIETVPLYAIVKRDHPWASKKSISVEELATARIVSPHHPMDKMPFLEELFRRRGIDYVGVESAPQLDSLLDVLSTGNKVPVGTILNSNVPGGSLVYIPIEEGDFTEDVSLLYRADNTNPNIQKLIDSISLVPKPSEMSAGDE